MVQGAFVESPFSCVTLAQTGASITGSTRSADGYEHGQRARFENSPMNANDINDGSFVGSARVMLTFPPSLASLCASGPRVRSTSVTGMFTFGPSCGPSRGALTIYRIAPPGLMCGWVYSPAIITAGSD